MAAQSIHTDQSVVQRDAARTKMARPLIPPQSSPISPYTQPPGWDASSDPLEQLRVPPFLKLLPSRAEASFEAATREKTVALEAPEKQACDDSARLSFEQETKLFKELDDMYEQFVKLAVIVPDVSAPKKVGRCIRYVKDACARCSAVEAGADTRLSFPHEEPRQVIESLHSLQAEILSVRDRLITANQGLVFYTVNSLCLSDLRKKFKDDLVSAGMIGLMHAVDGFNSDYGNRFSTYAVKVIRSSVFKTLEVYGLSRRKQEGVQVVSLHGAGRNDDDVSYLDVLEDLSTVKPEARVETHDELEVLRAKILAKLPQVQLSTVAQTEIARALLRAVIGLEGGESMQMKAAADSLNVSFDKAKNIFRIALRQAGISEDVPTKA